ncbi:MAG: fibronectin type protein, partial [Pseudarthrobacter sp.]|nr:fibronectin type protein [Pseudarthrobacter sp.]
RKVPVPTVASSPEATPRLRRELVLFFPMVRSVALAVIVIVVAALVSAVPAAAYWRASGTGSTTASVATLLPPTNVQVPASSNSSVTVSWTASLGAIVPTGYYVTRLTGSTAMAACGSSPSALVASASCTDTSVPEGTHRYLVTAVYRSWTAVSAESSNVTVTSLRDLSYASQPAATVTAGSAITSFQVQLRTIWGLEVWEQGVPITVSIGANPGGGTLSGTTTAYTNWSGTATFTGLRIDKAGTGYTLIASSPGYAGIASRSFSVVPAAASKLAVTGGAALAGPASSAALLGPVTIQRQDAYGNPVTAGSTTLTLATSTATGFFAAVSNGIKVTTVGIPDGSSSASFFYGDTKVGTATITAAAPGLAAPAAVTATISAAAPGKLLFDAITTEIEKNKPILPTVTVRIVDAFGNPTDASVPVTVQSNCSLKNNVPKTSTGGVASFPELEVPGKATGCTLTATSGTLTAATSNTFNVN